MSSCAVFLMGPAGTGKTTFCKNMSEYFETLGRKTCIFNLDPGIVTGKFHFSIHDKWSVSDIMEEYQLGPNGGMIKCLELCANDPHWLSDQIVGYTDEIMFVDCPGQIELYIHDNSMKHIIETFKNCGYNVCCLYLIDSTFMRDNFKLNSALLNALSAMISIDTGFISVLTKMDLVLPEEKEAILDQNTGIVIDTLEETEGPNQDCSQLIVSIEDILKQFTNQSLVAFDKNDSDDYYIIANYIDRMLCRDT